MQLEHRRWREYAQIDKRARVTRTNVRVELLSGFGDLGTSRLARQSQDTQLQEALESTNIANFITGGILFRALAT